MSQETATSTDILVVGGGPGGVAAALAALDRGRSVLLTEETDWIGGQLTSQGVPPDEHTWIEQFGATRRRIVARRRIVEQDLSLAVRGEHGAVRYPDSVGVGMYRIDLHPSTGGRLRNLLPVCKNIGTTHITNGCYRLHPVEWNIGEAAGSLAAHCLDNRLEVEQVYEDGERLRRFQDELTRAGVERAWPEVKGY